jgi:N-methylhydantoinase A
VLGYLNPDYFLGGKMKLELDAAKKAITEKVAEPLGLTMDEAAWGINEIVNENMARAAQVHMAERGSDPRRYALVAFGGAGPVHAFRVARKLGVSRIICPLGAGVASAIGLMVAPCRVDLVRAYMTSLDHADWTRIQGFYAAMEEEAKNVLKAMRIDRAAVTFMRQADMRYRGQGYEIIADLPDGCLGPGSVSGITTRFAETYQKLYGRILDAGTIEAVNWRLAALHERRIEHGLSMVLGRAAPDDPLEGRRPVFLPEMRNWAEVPVYSRYALHPEVQFPGPAIVEERESTVVIGSQSVFYCDKNGNLIADLEG